MREGVSKRVSSSWIGCIRVDALLLNEQLSLPFENLHVSLYRVVLRLLDFYLTTVPTQPTATAAIAAQHYTTQHSMVTPIRCSCSSHEARKCTASSNSVMFV